MQRTFLAYMSMLNSAHVVDLMYVCGATGASVLLAAVSDFIFIVTVHLFCFHVYTMR